MVEKINIDLNQKDKIFKGDSISKQISVNESIANWEIRAELYDLTGNSSKIATANVTGGSSDQITIDNATTGEFTLNWEDGETTDFDNEIWMEIERTDASGNVRTIFKQKILLEDEEITWTEVS
ncbi:MAG TPA: hypothetical protein VMX17_10135 [Candidatus Glassbacteria bacterium]|nr:hypothetical protein [Candidatus Glassbacteria bacterium]